mgnify:CR=1 FL=1
MSDMKIDTRIHPAVGGSGSLLARADVTLGGCFAIRGIRIMQGNSGPFVAMPSFKQGDEYKDVCFPCTKEFAAEFRGAVLDAYTLSLEHEPSAAEIRQNTEHNMDMSM